MRCCIHLVSTRNRTTTARLEETIITTKKGCTINGGIIVENKQNPFDKKLLDWSDCSDIGKEVLRLYKSYIDNIVKWKEQETVLGKGEWLGMYQYHRIVNIPKECRAAEVVEERIKGWGLHLDSIRLQDIEMPDDLKRIMSRQPAGRKTGQTAREKT